MMSRKKIVDPLPHARENHSESPFSFVKLLSRLVRSDKVILYQGSSNCIVTVYFYRHDPRHLFVSAGDDSVRIDEAEVPAVEAGIDKFLQDAT